MAELGYMVIGGVLWNNIVLTYLLGLFPFFGERPSTVKANLCLGLTTTVVMAVAVVAAYGAHELVLVPLELVYLKYLVTILLLLIIVVLADLLFRNYLQHLLPRVFMNSAAFGTVLLSLGDWNGPLEAVGTAVGFGLGVTGLLIVVETIDTRPETQLAPSWLRGMPLQFVTLGMLALAIAGFQGI